ncbi:MAG: nitrogen regulation protein NR(II) [Nitrospiria bacterium]
MDRFRSNEHASLILNSLKTGVIVVGETGRILFANRNALEILKRSLETLEQLRIGALFFPVEDLLEQAGKTERRELDVKRPDGSVVTIGFSVSEIDHADSFFNGRQYTITFQDITRWNELSRDRDRLLQIATVGQVMPTILHELKNPLAAISTAVEVLLEEERKPETQEALHAILSEIRRMKLVFEGIGATQRELRTSRYMAVDLAIQEALLVLKAKAKRGNVRLSSKICRMPLLPLETTVIRAILFNLVSNAVDACRPGDEINLNACLKQDGAVLELTISDTGCGMSDAVRARCTDLFVTTKPSGSGIGLSMCKSAIDTAGGTLRIESKENEGTRVTVTIPTRLPERDGSAISETPRKAS